MIVAVTGHRPDKLGGYSVEVSARLVELAINRIDLLSPEKVLTGMALGWDHAVAVACIVLGIPFMACVPCDNQEKMWPQKSKNLHKNLLRCASETVVVNPGAYQSWKMQSRNVYMVDRCDKLLALWNGTSGGTANCVRYAESICKPIVNCWEQWK
jgi:uncharacterized phage-like protein YoqJ